MAQIGTIRLCRRFTLLLVIYGIGISLAFAAVLLVGRISFPAFVLLGSSVAGVAMILIAAFAVCVSLKCPNCDLPYFAKGSIGQRLLFGRFHFRARPCCNCGLDAFQNLPEEPINSVEQTGTSDGDKPPC